jgi:PII-like signaling protein
VSTRRRSRARKERAGVEALGDEYLKLTTYFAERLRSEDRFLADALLDLYGESAVATSVVLRGIASFGPHHELRSDQSLSMSEDSPIAVAAVDRADKIAPLADRVVAMTRRGLVTLERARLLVEPDVSETPDTVKLTVYVGRQDRVSRRPAHVAVCEVLHRHGFAGAAVFLGVDGTKGGQRRRARFFNRNVDVPVMIIAIGTGDRAVDAIGELEAMLHQPLLTLERVQLCKRDGQLLARPAALPAADDHGRPLWQKLMIYTSEATLHDGVPIHRAIVQRLFDSRAATGATVLRGIWGYHGDHKPHGDKMIQLTRQVPVTTIVVDSPERISASFDIIDDLTDRHGLITSELVPALVSIDGGERRGGTALARYHY